MSSFPVPPAISAIDLSPEYMIQLRSFLQPDDVLEAIGYILQELSSTVIERKKRCQKCGRRTYKRGHDRREGVVNQISLPTQNEDEMIQCVDPGNEMRGHLTIPSQTSSKGYGGVLIPAQQPPGLRCKFHDGVVRSKMWSCCGKHVSSAPCKGEEFHVSLDYQIGELESSWKFYVTPAIVGASSDIRQAVAIDCEMGTAKSGESELIRVTLIDYFSTEVLVDSLVSPDVDMLHYNTRFSGVSASQMRQARSQGRCLRGKRRAREAVWRFVGPNTVVIGHSAHNDLNSMRWIHYAVVDTWLIESMNANYKDTEARQLENSVSTEPVSIDKGNEPKDDQQEKPKKKKKGSGALSLKTLTMLRWGREIQTNGSRGHDSLEDAIATRDLAHWNVKNKYCVGDSISMVK